jgi:hypothetical protein
MLNFFFPFLNTTAQPNPEPEPAAVQKTRQRAETATPGHSDHLPGPDPVPQPQAPHRKSAGSSAKRATKPAGQVRAKKVVAGRGRTKQQPKQGEPQATRSAPVSKRPEVAEAPQQPVLVEAGQAASKRVERGARAGRWGTNAHRRSSSAASLPAGQRWKRRLPRASW